MLGKTVVVTGASDQLGVEATFELAKAGAKVIMASAEVDKAEKTRKCLIERLKAQPSDEDYGTRLVVKRLDLCSFRSIREFALEVNKTESRLDVLINSAVAIGTSERQLTEDGLEMTMAANHFGHFLLTNLLLPLLKRSAPSRIIVVSSSHYQDGTLRFDNLNSEKSYNLVQAYCTSKLANVYFTLHLSKLLQGTQVTVNAVHASPVDADTGKRGVPKWAQIFFSLITRFFKTPREGAQSIVQLAYSQEPAMLASGQYFVDRVPTELRPFAMDESVAKQLWNISEKITSLS